ncbi:MAG: PTS sugar transporter subunit IIB [Oscillospiraceae bacterium]|nr:PTS sugar transporter subunit IIB [Oscillospiraceae bacterium]MCL2279741.1 PTS sugar transporter subunit IIB [Oscillospiraceae bacterium]
MKIVCVCGLGMGSSLILKMTVESAMQKLGIHCDVEHWAAGTMDTMNVDLIVAAEDFRDELQDCKNVVFVTNIVKVDEVKEVLEVYLKSKGLI